MSITLSDTFVGIREQIIAAQRRLEGDKGKKVLNKAKAGPKIEVNGLKRGEKERRIAAFNFFVRDMVSKIRQEDPNIDHQRYVAACGVPRGERGEEQE